MNKTHKFTSIKFKRQLRELTNYVQRRVWEFRQQQPAPDGPPIAQVQVPSQRTVFRQASPPQPYPVQASQSNQDDYYIEDQTQTTGGQAWRGQMGHVAHRLGSAATQSAHNHAPTLPSYRPFNPYAQGSLMTRRPISGPPPQTEY